MKYENVDKAVELRDVIRVLRLQLKKYEEIMNLLQNPGVEKSNLGFEIHVGNWGNNGLILATVPTCLLQKRVIKYLIEKTNEQINEALAKLEAL